MTTKVYDSRKINQINFYLLKFLIDFHTLLLISLVSDLVDWDGIPLEFNRSVFFVVVVLIVFVRYFLGGLVGDLLYFNKIWTTRLGVKSFVECTLAFWECCIVGRCWISLVLDVLFDGCWCTRLCINVDPLDCGTTTEPPIGCCNAFLVKRRVDDAVFWCFLIFNREKNGCLRHLSRSDDER